ncbi:MAG: HAD hydrolase-like protein [Spirochaetota bacterium]
MQNFFFDLDGTIVNSEPGLLIAHSYSLERLGHQSGLAILQREGVGWTIGPPLGLTVPRLIGSEDSREVRKYIETFQKAYLEIYYKDFILYDGIDEVLRKLKEQGKTIFVCTSKPEPIARKLMKFLNYEELLCDLIGAHLDERPHEKSDLLRELCQKYGCRPEESVMVGDRSYDMSAGTRLDFAARVGVTYGFGSEEELLAHGATHIVHQAREILEIFSEGEISGKS